jgi:hypothetical protein
MTQELRQSLDKKRENREETQSLLRPRSLSDDPRSCGRMSAQNLILLCGIIAGMY